MENTLSSRHSLNLTWPNDRACTKAVFVFQRTFQDNRDDFHVPVWVRVKPGARNDHVIIDYTKRTKPHTLWVHKMAERKSMFAVQPACFCFAANIPVMNTDHLYLQ